MAQKLTDFELLNKVQSTVAELQTQTQALVTGLLAVSPVGMAGRYGSGTEYLKQAAESFKEKNEQLLVLKQRCVSDAPLNSPNLKK